MFLALRSPGVAVGMAAVATGEEVTAAAMAADFTAVAAIAAVVVVTVAAEDIVAAALTGVGAPTAAGQSRAAVTPEAAALAACRAVAWATSGEPAAWHVPRAAQDVRRIRSSPDTL